MRTYESKMWDELLTFLGSLGQAREISPGRIQLHVRDTGHDVEIIMTRDEWVEMSTVKWGDFTDAAEDIKRTVLATGADDRFLIYGDYDLEPSPTPHRAADPEQERLNALLAANGGKAIGRWLARNDDGGLSGEFRDFPDESSL